MPGIDWNISPPNWLQAAATWQDTGGLQALQIGLQAAQNQQRLDLAKEKAKTDYEMQRVQMATDQFKLKAMQDEQAAWLKDAPVVAGLWAQPSPQAILAAPAPVTSKQGVMAVSKIKDVAAAHLAQSTVSKDINDFRVGMQPINAEDRARILAMPGTPSGPTADQWGELNKARESIGLPRVGVAESSQPQLAKLISAKKMAEESGDADSAKAYQMAIDRMQKQTMGAPVREQKLWDMANEIEATGDIESATAIRNVAKHQFSRPTGPVTPTERAKVLQEIQKLSVSPAEETEPDRVFREGQILLLKKSLQPAKPAAITPSSTLTKDPLGLFK